MSTTPTAAAPRMLACTVSTTLPDKSDDPTPMQLPLPGVMILVHGVNSDGEWYEATEQGLCDGLNARLARRDDDLVHTGVAAGQLQPAAYTPELTPDGFLRPNRDDQNFIRPAPFWSPVIRFRWGYKACNEELQDYGGNVWLNQNDYWGGGPFANGCSTAADLWHEGLNDRLFLWITAQHMNPVAGRDAYACPPRAYYVHAALRLARLIESVRAKQEDCPVTVVCHSQGTVVGLAAAFLADKIGVQADAYVLSNAPLSLLPNNFTESWSQRGTRGDNGQRGRVTLSARTGTFKSFFEMLRARAGCEQDAAAIDRRMANTCATPGYTAAADRAAHGLGGHTYGRVTLYCNPHDQVVSALTLWGIGWRGLSAAEIEATGAAGVFTQRVFAQGYEVGQAPGGKYHYWNNRWNKDQEFWHPPSPPVRYRLKQGLESSTTAIGKFLTVILAPLLGAATGVTSAFGIARVNAEPDKDWEIPIDAPQLPEAFLPKSRRYGQDSDRFDEGVDPEGNARNKDKAEHDPDDPYDAHETQPTVDGTTTDAPMGDEQSEAYLRYQHRARQRMR